MQIYAESDFEASLLIIYNSVNVPSTGSGTEKNRNRVPVEPAENRLMTIIVLRTSSPDSYRDVPCQNLPLNQS
jgi:hypothetical protein